MRILAHGLRPCLIRAAVLSASYLTVTPSRPTIAHKHVLIAGATATGKSALAMEVAPDLGGVIVNADSQQLYEGLPILTARPTREDEAAVPHQLYGVANPADAWSVGKWLEAVSLLLAQEERPLVIVGGTGLYFLALLRGLAPVPNISPAERDGFASEFQSVGEMEFRRRLLLVDAEAEARISSGDKQRLIRAMAVAMTTGRSLSDWQRERSPALLKESDCTLHLVTRPREEIYARCDARVDQMFSDGVIDEVRAFLARNLSPDKPAMRSVGLPEIAAALRNEISLEQAIELTKRNTRRYAKRQLTWQRNQMRNWPVFSLDLSTS